jgi:hypothetical protein
MDRDGAMSWAAMRTAVGSGPAVTSRASPVFVRADSSSPVAMVPGSPDLPERHSGFVRASPLQRSSFDLLRLPSSLDLPTLGAMSFPLALVFSRCDFRPAAQDELPTTAHVLSLQAALGTCVDTVSSSIPQQLALIAPYRPSWRDLRAFPVPDAKARYT